MNQHGVKGQKLTKIKMTHTHHRFLCTYSPRGSARHSPRVPRARTYVLTVVNHSRLLLGFTARIYLGFHFTKTGGGTSIEIGILFTTSINVPCFHPKINSVSSWLM